MNTELKTILVDGKIICVSGIGQMYYQDGFPIQIAIETLEAKGVNVSILHIADELYKHGWDKKRILAALETDTGKHLEGSDLVEQFINAGSMSDCADVRPKLVGREYIYGTCGYEAQRQMLFNSLFGSPSINFMSIDGVNEITKRSNLF